MVKIIQITTRGAAALIALLVFFSGAIAAGQTQAYLGSVVTLSGYSYTSYTVYLFLTGPNLPPNGVSLDNINRPADQGGATQVDVDGDGHWVYPWNTGSLGLDAGSYTVWVADGPADVSHLTAVDYTYHFRHPFRAIYHCRDRRGIRPVGQACTGRLDEP